jgi:calpain
LFKVVPDNVNLSGDDYDGSMTFNFWRYGNWQPVTIDDQLPADANGLVFSRCVDPDEFWLPLLEKAYAKLVFFLLSNN